MIPLRSRAIRALASACHRTGITGPVSRAVGYTRRVPAFPIITYHRVNDDGDPFLAAMPTGVFEEQIAWMARTYQIFTVEELVQRAGHNAVPRNAIALTFDDGYRDNLTHAAPVLARHGVPATIFLATGFIGTSRSPWYDQVAVAFKRTRCESWQAPWGAGLSLGTATARVRALEQALAHLKRRPGDELRRDLDTLFRALDVPETASPVSAMLSWDDVRALRELGFSIGAHTVTHPILSRLSLEQAWTEIAECRTMIESALGVPPRAFAYPNGGPDDYTAAVTDLVRRAGFACAVTTRFGLNTSATCRWELRRGGPWEDHLATFALKLAWYRLGPAGDRETMIGAAPGGPRP